MPTSPQRRTVLAGLVALSAGPAPAVAQARFDPRHVVRLAEQAARRPYVSPPLLPPALAALDYDAYRRVQVVRERMLWAGEGLGFTADLLPRGYLFPQRLAVHVVDDGRATPVATDGLWRADAAVAAALDGASGLRLQHPLNWPSVHDEVAVFQGGSYFRSLGRGQSYGLSARGLALGAGDMGEEHPAFTALWLERPAPAQDHIVLHALLDGPSVTGAYRFHIRPGESTVFDVETTLFPRVDLDRLGVAPLTSMFFFAPQDRNGVDDFRAAAHDSDGLALLTRRGERLWRPLANPPSATRISVFPADGVRGFGLQQRARALTDYHDLEARYDRRPSLWVEPLEDWGPGEVRLVELPARHEGEDNIAAFWRPREPWRAGRRRTLRYRLHWGAGDPALRPPLTVAATRVGADGEGGVRRIVIDWTGEASAMTGAVAVASSDAGTILNVMSAPHFEASTLRSVLRFRHPPVGEAVVRLHLAREGTPVSEHWQYRWTA